MMEFALSEEQQLLQDSVNKFLVQGSNLDRVREMVQAQASHGLGLWQGLTDMGLTGIIIPEAYGGSDMSILDAAIVAESLGAAVAPTAYIAAAVMAPLAIKLGGSEQQQQQYLPDIVTGNRRFAVAVSEQCGAREGAGADFANGKLSGKCMFVLDSANATALIVADKQAALYIVATDAQGLRHQQLNTIDKTRSCAEFVFDNVEAEPLSLAGAGSGVCQKVINVGRVMLAADTLGAAQIMIDKAVEYAKERKQFNRLIGSFQAVKHLCAEMAAELEPSRSLLWYAAHAQDEVPQEATMMAAQAKSHLTEGGRFIARTSTEVHGGMGITDLLGLHYWFKRIGVNRQWLGSPERLREEAAKAQGWI